MHLASSATRRQAPSPSWRLVRDASPLELVELLVDVGAGMKLDIVIPHRLWALWTGNIVVGNALYLYGDPLFEACPACVDEMVAGICRSVLGKG